MELFDYSYSKKRPNLSALCFSRKTLTVNGIDTLSLLSLDVLREKRIRAELVKLKWSNLFFKTVCQPQGINPEKHLKMKKKEPTDYLTSGLQARL